MIGGQDESELWNAVEAAYSEFFLPHAVVAPASAEQAIALATKIPLLGGRLARDNRITTYICENFTCQEPVLGVAALVAGLEKLAPQSRYRP
jgi:hypothetical protein